MSKSKLISIDTSIFGDIAKDFFSENELLHLKARDTVNHLVINGFIPFITFHHILEILQHDDTDTVLNRWSLFREFPFIAWLRSCDEDAGLGSIVDIHKIEVSLTVDGLGGDVDLLAKTVKDTLVCYTKGDAFVELFQEVYMQIRELGVLNQQRSKEIESISHASDKDIDKIKLSTLFDYQLRSPSDMVTSLKCFERNLCESLQKSGDSKLANPEAVAANFTAKVLHGSIDLFRKDISLYEAYILSSGVRIEQVSPNTTIGQLGRLSVYNKQLKDILNAMCIPAHFETKVPYKTQITWAIWEHFDAAMKFEKFAHGSNMQDKHMCVFALFTDIFTVDKRVCEYFRQLTRKNKTLNVALGSVVKLSHYTNLESLNEERS